MPSLPQGERARAEARMVLTFLAVGAVVAATNLATFALLVHLGVGYLAAAVAGFVLSTVVSYEGNRRFTFRDAPPPTPRQAATFLAVQLGGLVINLAVLTALVELADVREVPAELVASVCQSTATFLTNRFVTFRPAAAPGPR